MLAKQENIQRIINFQKQKSTELKRPITYGEAIAMWMTQKEAIQNEEVQHHFQKAKESFIF